MSKLFMIDEPTMVDECLLSAVKYDIIHKITSMISLMHFQTYGLKNTVNCKVLK